MLHRGQRWDLRSLFHVPVALAAVGRRGQHTKSHLRSTLSLVAPPLLSDVCLHSIPRVLTPPVPSARGEGSSGKLRFFPIPSLARTPPCQPGTHQASQHKPTPPQCEGETWQEGKSESFPLSHHHASSLALENRQLRARMVVKALVSAPLKGDTVSCTPRGRSRQLPTAAAGAGMSFHWPRAALLIQTWLVFRANTYLPRGQQPAWEKPNCYKGQDSRAGEGTEGLGRNTSAQKRFSPSNSIQTTQENTASQPLACPYTHLHRQLHAPDTHAAAHLGAGRHLIPIILRLLKDTDAAGTLLVLQGHRTGSLGFTWPPWERLSHTKAAQSWCLLFGQHTTSRHVPPRRGTPLL